MVKEASKGKRVASSRKYITPIKVADPVATATAAASNSDNSATLLLVNGFIGLQPFLLHIPTTISAVCAWKICCVWLRFCIFAKGEKGLAKKKKKEKKKCTAQTVIKKSSNKQPYRISTLAQMQSEGERANGTSVSCLLVRFLVAQQAK